MNQYITIILASSVIATVLSTIINYFISVRLKRLDYKNEYYKTIIQKRLEVYQYIEEQITYLRAVMIDENDNKIYHALFNEGFEKAIDLQNNLIMAIAYSLWIDKDTSDYLQEMNL